MKNFTQQEIDYSRAQERVRQTKKFYFSFAFFLLVFAVYNLFQYNKTGQIPFVDDANFSVIFWIWGIILALKAVKLFYFNQSWERKMMEKELNKK